MSHDPARWQSLPRPLAFVLGGGATLGALQVGMLRALGEVGIHPDLVVGTSVGALNGAVLADVGDVAQAAELLADSWSLLTTEHVFPGSLWAQGRRVLAGESAFPDDGLRRIVHDFLGPTPTFEELALPFAAVASHVLVGHPHAFAAGDLVLPLLASAALPGVLPVQEIDGEPYWDGGVTSNVPLLAARAMGAVSIVVLDPGDICHREIVPSGVAETTVAAFGTAIRQRVLIEVPQVAAEIPVLYLDRPCVTGRAPLSFASTPDLLARGHDVARKFLATADVPTAGHLVGRPHTHVETHGDLGTAHHPRFPRGLPTVRER